MVFFTWSWGPPGAFCVLISFLWISSSWIRSTLLSSFFCLDISLKAESVMMYILQWVKTNTGIWGHTRPKTDIKSLDPLVQCYCAHIKLISDLVNFVPEWFIVWTIRVESWLGPTWDLKKCIPEPKPSGKLSKHCLRTLELDHQTLEERGFQPESGLERPVRLTLTVLEGWEYLICSENTGV